MERGQADQHRWSLSLTKKTELPIINLFKSQTPTTTYTHRCRSRLRAIKKEKFPEPSQLSTTKRETIRSKLRVSRTSHFLSAVRRGLMIPITCSSTHWTRSRTFRLNCWKTRHLITSSGKACHEPWRSQLSTNTIWLRTTRSCASTWPLER